MPRWLAGGLGDQRDRRVLLVSPERAAEGQPAGAMSRSCPPPSGPRSRAPRWPTRRLRCTSCRTSSPPATSPAPGATRRSDRARTTTTTRTGWRSSLGPGGSHSIVLMGDAHMRPEDADVASRACAQPRASTGCGIQPARRTCVCAHPAAPAAPDPFDVCRNDKLPRRDPELRVLPEQARLFEANLATTPVPSLGPGLGAMPRFRSEVGLFVGFPGPSTGARSTAASWPRRASAAQWRGSTCRSAQASDWTA